MKAINKKAVIIAVFAVLLVICVILVGFTRAGSPKQAEADNIRMVTLSSGDIQRTVSATGIVYSAEVTNVYSTLTHTVRTVTAKVGDRVNAGDILAELDTASLERDIEQKKITLSNSQASAYQKLADARRALQNSQRDLENGTALINAEASVTSAEINLRNAEIDLETKRSDARSARSELRDAHAGEGNYVGGVDDQTLEQLGKNASNAEAAFDKAVNTLEQCEKNLANAKASLEAAKISNNDSLETYNSQVRSAEIAANFDSDLIALDRLESDLAKCVITAPVSGVITAVNAVEGSSGSGLLFVIQDDSNLKIVANIKEYDIGSVAVGNKVVIKADATGDREFQGALSKIAPTSLLTATGSAAASTEAQYESEISVLPGRSGLLIGMNTRLSIIVEEKSGVFSVPYEALTEVEGQWYVYTRETGADGKTVNTMIPVEKGLESNLYAEVSGDGLQEGMEIVKNALDISGRNISTINMFGGGF